jgi:hypothetical protein
LARLESNQRKHTRIYIFGNLLASIVAIDFLDDIRNGFAGTGFFSAPENRASRICDAAGITFTGQNYKSV